MKSKKKIELNNQNSIVKNWGCVCDNKNKVKMQVHPQIYILKTLISHLLI